MTYNPTHGLKNSEGHAYPLQETLEKQPDQGTSHNNQHNHHVCEMKE